LEGILIGEPKATIGKTLFVRQCCAGSKSIIGMAFIPQISSGSAQKPFVCKTHFGAKDLPCFSKLQNETRPFFVQWQITALDIARIRSISYDAARQEMQKLRSYYGKLKHGVVTIEEYCFYSGIKKGLVRMHIMSRKMENELKRQYSASRTEMPNLKFHKLKIVN
jgi:hypothetical protein